MENTSNNNKLIALYFILIITTIIAFLLYFLQYSFSSELFQKAMLFLIGINTLIYISIRIRKYGEMRLLSISTIFILGYFVVFYQVFLLDLFGFELVKVYYKLIWISKEVMQRSFGIASIGLLAFYVGASSIKLRSHKNIKNAIDITSPNSIFVVLTLAYVFYILFFIFAGSYRYGIYYAKDASPLAVYLYKLFVVCLSAAVIIKISHITSYKEKKLSAKQYLSNLGFPLLFLLIWHIAFSTFVGDRGPVISFTLLAFAMYFIRWQKLNLLRIIVAVFLIAFLLTLIGKIRSYQSLGLEYGKRFSKVVSEYSEKEGIDSKFGIKIPASETIELALSIQTLNYSLYNVPDFYKFRYGLFQLNYFISIIPGLSGMTNSLLYDGMERYKSSSTFITYLIQGDNPSYGNGTSIIADFYLDFGVLGVVVGLYLLGFFVGRNESRLWKGYQKPTLLWIAILILFSKSLYLNRSSIGLEFSNIVLIFLFIKLNTTLVIYFKKMKSLKLFTK
ncbi:MAG: oligosaccharide repeat unit polymerase [Candidatus Cloacimonetes bacterium]|nr:oligosaccharide repeat unit polymerase [Candidatus Cloacimonadota bacterium]